MSCWFVQPYTKGFWVKKPTGMILTDLLKALDNLDHDIFLGKMKYLGFTSKAINSFGFYVKKWNIVVTLEKTLLETGILNCDDTQGSILGPILFSLYVNDMKTAMKNGGIRLYADDMCILYNHQNVKFTEINLNFGCNNFCEWFIDNKPSIHFGEDKIKSISFKRRKKSLIKHNTKWKRYKTALSGRIIRLLIGWKYVRRSYG